VDAEQVFGNAQRHVRTGEFGRVHVAVDPYRRAGVAGVAADGQQRDLAALGAGAEAAQVCKAGVLLRPGVELGHELGVGEVVLAVHRVSVLFVRSRVRFVRGARRMRSL
jgi:hypothetical protein